MGETHSTVDVDFSLSIGLHVMHGIGDIGGTGKGMRSCQHMYDTAWRWFVALVLFLVLCVIPPDEV